MFLLFYCDKTITELIVPTKKAWELFKEKYMVDRNVHIVPTGIDTDRFKPENNKNVKVEKERNKIIADNERLHDEVDYIKTEYNKKEFEMEWKYTNRINKSSLLTT